MNQQVLEFYLQYSRFTYPGLYQSYLKTLPNDITKIGYLVRKQLIHRTTLRDGNTGTNANLEYGDMTKIPWHQQPEDDYFITASSILAELFRRDERGLVADRSSANKLILTCRATSILAASILKTKGCLAALDRDLRLTFRLTPKKEVGIIGSMNTGMKKKKDGF